MLSVTVRLLHGTIRTGSPDDTVLAGGDTVGEWPPSPARLFSALVAADGTGSRCTRGTGSELSWLETLEPPLIYAAAHHVVARSSLLPRFVVVDHTQGGVVQDYPARQAKEVRPGVRLAPRDDTISYIWPNADPSEAQLEAFRYRSARVGYLGCADSPVQVSVADSADGLDTEPWRPDDRGDLTLPVPYPGFLDALDRAYIAWSGGEAMRRSWIPSRRARYRPPGGGLDPFVPSSRAVIWLRFERSVSGRRLLQVTEALKAALLDHLQRLLPDTELPVVLHGHRGSGEYGSQVDFLALPDVGYPRASGRLLGAAVSVPSDAGADLIQQVRTAALSLSVGELTRREDDTRSTGGFRVKLSVYGGERRPWAAVPERWSGPSSSWVSVTPVIHERWSKGRPDIEEVARWCLHAGVPEAAELVAVRFSEHPLVAGALDLPPSLVFRSATDRRPHSHLHLRFRQRVEGPIVVGRGRQFGFGLMAPDRDGQPGANE